MLLMALTAMAAHAATRAPALQQNDASGDALRLRWALDLAEVPTRAPTASVNALQGTASALPLLLEAAQRAAANRAADAGVDAARAQAQQAWRAAWMPRLDAAASRLQQKTRRTVRQDGSTADASTSGPTRNTTLSASLPVWRAADRAAADAQASVTEQSEWQAKGQRATTARDVSLAYIAAAEANEQRRLAEAQQELLQTQLHINDRRLQSGIGTVLDQLETRTRLDQVRASVQELAMRATSQRLAMERLTGLSVQLPAGFHAATAKAEPALPTLTEALDQAAERNPDIRDARAAVEAARHTNSARDAEFWQPTVDAVATLEKDRTSVSGSGISQTTSTTNRTAGVQLNWPLFTGGVQQGRVKEASALLVQAQARLDDTQSLVQTSLRDAYQNLMQAQAIIAAQQDVEATATATFEAVRKAFVAGMRTNLDLLNAQQQIYSARQSVVTARVTALSAQINILTLLDQLDAEHVAPLMIHFETEAAMATSPSASPLPSTTALRSLTLSTP